MRENESGTHQRVELEPLRALRHPMLLGATALLALNDHVLKGSGWVPGWLTGKLSDAAGMLVAPLALAALARAKTPGAMATCHALVGVTFGAIKASTVASSLFVGAVGVLGVPWRNWVDPTDLVVLPLLALSYVVFTRAARVERVGDAGQVGGAKGGALALAAIVPVLVASGDAGPMGGANAPKAPGGGSTGVDLSLGDIAVDPTGAYFVSTRSNRLLVGDLSTRVVNEVAGVEGVRRVTFRGAAAGRGVYLSTERVEGGVTVGSIVAYDLDARAKNWESIVEPGVEGMTVRPSDSRLVVWTAERVTVIDGATGSVAGTFAPKRGVRDVDVVGEKLVVTERTDGAAEAGPTTTIFARAMADAGPLCEIEVPNCATDLVVARGDRRAFLAPTTCGRDPVSVIDLEACKFEKNLPGFGPVALSTSEKTAVAFIDRDANDPTAPPLPEAVKSSKARYHLMFIDVATLEYGTIEAGDYLPRYAVTPDGKMLLVDSWFASQKLRVLDVETREIAAIDGPEISLFQFVMLPDARRIFAIDELLHRIDLAAKKAGAVDLSFKPTNINMTPDGGLLLLRDQGGQVRLYDVEQATEAGEVRVAAP